MKLVRDLSRGVALRRHWRLFSSGVLAHDSPTSSSSQEDRSVVRREFQRVRAQSIRRELLALVQRARRALPSSRPAPSASPCSSCKAARFTNMEPASSKHPRLNAASASRLSFRTLVINRCSTLPLARSVAPRTSWRLRGRRSPSMGVPLLRTVSRGASSAAWGFSCLSSGR